jgi:hypothetical protein
MQLDGLGLTPMQLAANKKAAQNALLHPAPVVIPANPPCPSDGVPGQGDIWTVTDADVVALRAGKKLYYLTPAHAVMKKSYTSGRSTPVVVSGMWNQGLVAGRNLPYQTLNAAQLTAIMQQVRVAANSGGFFDTGGLFSLPSLLTGGVLGGAKILAANTKPGTLINQGANAGIHATSNANAAAPYVAAAVIGYEVIAPLLATGGFLTTTAGGVVAAGESKIQSLVTQKVQGALTSALSPAQHLTTAPPVAPPAPALSMPPTVIIAMLGLLYTLLK